ncbi:MAG TPA: putative lipid II flippase FtsW [Thermoanaerobaculia bacterium]|nr:putative lipid II flippase FtsW [Thermoanaerobaculia bacterium]
MAKQRAFDRGLFTLVVLLVALGLVMVYSASAAVARAEGAADGLLANPYLRKQALAALIGLGAMLAAMHLDYRWLKRPAVAWALFGGAVVLLVAVLFAPPINGTRRWFLLGGLSLQPSELAKLALVPFVAYHLERKEDRVNRPALLLPVGLGTLLVFGLVLLEPDLGTALLLAVTVFLMLFVAGLSWRYIAAGAAIGLPVLAVLVWSESYRRARLFAFLDPEADPLGAGYQVLQSLIAVGTGGVFGLGLGNSIQKLFYLPYAHSDFIYSILAEELGLLGAGAVVLLFLALSWRGLRAAFHAPDAFGRYLGLGLTAMLVVQALVNISVTIALLPTKGIPLPFLSYGGTSLVVSMTACGVLLNLSEHG